MPAFPRAYLNAISKRMMECHLHLNLSKAPLHCDFGLSEALSRERHMMTILVVNVKQTVQDRSVRHMNEVTKNSQNPDSARNLVSNSHSVATTHIYTHQSKYEFLNFYVKFRGEKPTRKRQNKT